MLTKSEPIIFAVDLDETIYNSQAEGIEYLVDIKKFFCILANSIKIANAMNKDLYLCVITAKSKADDLVDDFISTSKKLFSDNLSIYFVGNHHGAHGIASRKLDCMKNIANEFNSNLEHIIFIDDNETNIMYAEYEGVNCILAHNNFIDQATATTNKTEMIRKATLASLNNLFINFKKTHLTNSTTSTTSTNNTSADELVTEKKYYPIIPIFNNPKYRVPCDLPYDYPEVVNSKKL